MSFDVLLMRSIACVKFSISILDSEASCFTLSVCFTASLLSFALCIVCSVRFVIVACNSSTAPACSVAPDANAIALCESCDEPKDTCSEETLICLIASLIFTIIVLQLFNKGRKAPIYLSSY